MHLSSQFLSIIRTMAIALVASIPNQLPDLSICTNPSRTILLIFKYFQLSSKNLPAASRSFCSTDHRCRIRTLYMASHVYGTRCIPGNLCYIVHDSSFPWHFSCFLNYYSSLRHLSMTPGLHVLQCSSRSIMWRWWKSRCTNGHDKNSYRDSGLLSA